MRDLNLKTYSTEGIDLRELQTLTQEVEQTINEIEASLPEIEPIPDFELNELNIDKFLDTVN